jgi:hypothetical protein
VSTTFKTVRRESLGYLELGEKAEMDTSNKVIEAENKKFFMLPNAQRKLMEVEWFLDISWTYLVIISEQLLNIVEVILHKKMLHGRRTKPFPFLCTSLLNLESKLDKVQFFKTENCNLETR